MLEVLKLKCPMNMQFDFKRYLNFCETSLWKLLWKIAVFRYRENMEYCLRKSLF